MIRIWHLRNELLIYKFTKTLESVVVATFISICKYCRCFTLKIKTAEPMLKVLHEWFLKIKKKWFSSIMQTCGTYVVKAGRLSHSDLKAVCSLKVPKHFSRPFWNTSIFKSTTNVLKVSCKISQGTSHSLFSYSDLLN